MQRIPDKVSMASCGLEHTQVLTINGEVYVMGSNSKNQLGLGDLSSRGCTLPTFLEELSFTKMIKVRSGSYSAALSTQNELYVWGEGPFGSFSTPHRIRLKNPLEIADFDVSLTGLSAIVTRSGKVYSWGANDLG